MLTIDILLQGLVVLGAIFVGVRTGGLGLGLWGVVGVGVLVFVFRLPPGNQPIDAMLIILAVITASAAMQAAGGIDYLVSVAARLIQRNPGRITIIAPLVAFLFTIAAGTGNIYFALIPIIYEVAYENKIRPERPLAVASVASQMGIVASPVSAAMAAMLTLVEPKGFSLVPILVIVLPASLIAILVASLVQMRIGRPLEADPEYQRRLAAGEIEPPVIEPVTEPPTGGSQLTSPATGASPAPEAAATAAAPQPGRKLIADLPREAKLSALFFLVGVTIIVLMGIFPELRPAFPDSKGKSVPLGMTTVIQLIMFAVATAIVIFAKAKPAQIVKMPLLIAGVTSLIALFGLAWLADTFIAANTGAIVSLLGNLVDRAPIAFALALFAVAALTTSQSGATRAIVPIGIALGLPAQFLVAMWPAVIGIYFFPANGSQIAAIGIDQTGTTRIGKYVVNHSFQLPTLICWVVAVLVGLLIAGVLHGF